MESPWCARVAVFFSSIYLVHIDGSFSSGYCRHFFFVTKRIRCPKAVSRISSIIAVLGADQAKGEECGESIVDVVQG